MKIAYDFQAFSQPYGGVALYFSKLAQLINNYGSEARIYSPLFRNEFIKDFSEKIVKGNYLNRYPPKTKKLIWQINKVLSYSNIKSWRPDILHQTYYNYFPKSFGEKARIITIYDMIHELFPDSFLENDQTTSLKLKAIERADHVICISDCTRRDLINLTGIASSKVSCINLGVDIPNKTYPYPLGVQKQTRPYLLYVGARTAYKNFLGLVAAYASSPRLVNDFDLLVVGGGTLTNQEMKMLNGLGVPAERVICTDTKEYSINSFYQHASALIYPSLYEGFGLPPLEAMSNRCPVISSNAGPLPEVYGDAAAYFSPASVDEMAWVIEDSLYNNLRLKELREFGMRRIQRYSWERCAIETINLYKSL